MMPMIDAMEIGQAAEDRRDKRPRTRPTVSAHHEHRADSDTA